MTLFKLNKHNLSSLLKASLLNLKIVMLTVIILVSGNYAYAAPDNCHGRLVNPITDICWSCIFPISIGSFQMGGVEELQKLEIDNPKNILCNCPKPDGTKNLIGGLSVGFYEPVKLVDVTREPYCMTGIGGLKLASSSQKGYVRRKSDSHRSSKESFYHVHVYDYPALSLMELMGDFACLERGDVNIGYMSEFDPMWNDDELTFLMNPESYFFANPITQTACAADCTASNIGYPLNTLSWCAGCVGSLYPMNGHVANHIGGVQASSLLVQRTLAKMHKLMMLPNTSGKENMCFKTPSPKMKKSQYKAQMTYPIAATSGVFSCNPLGRSDLFFGSGKEFPYKGEDYGYIIWRKRTCCAF